MSISVRCEVPEYKDISKFDKVIVESVWSESSMVKITFGDKTVKVNGKDMTEAINRCINSSWIAF